MLIFLTPHVIDDESDLEEVYRIKVAQRQEFIRRFYGKSRDLQEKELANILSYSMNQIDQPSRYRGNQKTDNNWEIIGNTAPANQVIQPTENEESSETTPEENTSEESSETNQEDNGIEETSPSNPNLPDNGE